MWGLSRHGMTECRKQLEPTSAWDWNVGPPRAEAPLENTVDVAEARSPAHLLRGVHCREVGFPRLKARI